MDIEEIKKLWKNDEPNTQASLDWWDSKADSFRLKELPTAENSLALEITKREGLIKNGDKVLDVGCGGGRLSFALEAMGAEVTGTDFSSEMIKNARESARELGSKVNFVQADWHNADIKALGWEKSFDLVLANMTPAVISAETFLKLIEASRSRVLMVKPVKRISPIYDELIKIASLTHESCGLKDTLDYSLEILLSMGISPRLQYQRGVSDSTRPLDPARDDYIKRLSAKQALTKKHIEDISAFFESTAEEGTIRERVEWTVAAVYFSVTQ